VRTALQAPPRPLYVAEPRGTWLQRRPLVVDCSVMAAFLFAEPAAEQAASQLADHALHAPTLLPYEVANVAATKQRRGATAEEIATALTDFAEQRIELLAVPPDGAAAIAGRYGLTAYDAAYLWLAAELQAPLATFDHRLAAAARRHLGLPD